MMMMSTAVATHPLHEVLPQRPRRLGLLAPAGRAIKAQAEGMMVGIPPAADDTYTSFPCSLQITHFPVLLASFPIIKGRGLSQVKRPDSLQTLSRPNELPRRKAHPISAMRLRVSLVGYWKT
jgi:hypothetical protein